MLRILIIASAVIASVGPTRAWADESVTVQDISMIRAVLAELKCRFTEGDVKKEGEEFVLTDAFCASGQFDFRFDAKFTILSQRPN